MNNLEENQRRLHDYGVDIVSAIRASDLLTLQKLRECGRSMLACNKYSESIVHMACRRSDLDVVKFLMEDPEAAFLIDDLGRTPLHDACWRPEPRFDIVAIILDQNVELIRCKDKRGATPLHYVRREHWQIWCAFLQCQKEKYWPVVSENTVNSTASASSSDT